MDKSGEDNSGDELYNPSNIAGDDVWQPDPKVIVELYEKLDKEGVLELKWKCQGRVSVKSQSPLKNQEEVAKETPEAELKLREKQKMLSMFEADDIDVKVNTPSALNKTPKTPRSNVKVKASFDKIFSKVSTQATSNSEHDT